MKVNYQKKLEEILQRLPAQGKKPVLALHCCCAPCSSYVLEYLADYFEMKLVFFNPNIAPESEYVRRLEELRDLLAHLNMPGISLVEGAYDPQVFYARVKGLEHEPEGAGRCRGCFKLRLEELARQAVALGADYFTTTLSISPHKDAQALNEIGAVLEQTYRVPYLYSDFKKKDGFKRSLALSSLFGLYRQDYCGCVFSKHAGEKGEVHKIF